MWRCSEDGGECEMEGGGVHWRLKTDEMEGCVGGRGGNINENEGGGRQEL